jgi:RsiW-degrading membrane proteinase PrsW (M82 family)
VDVFFENTVTPLVKFAVSILPVLAFLVALVYLDSFKLVALRHVLRATFAGALAAVASLWLNETILHTLRPDFEFFSRYDAPLVEEFFKALYVAYLIRSKKVGFVVDAVIFAFAVGAGFALVENLYFLKNLTTDQAMVWIVRGFGTAALHAATMVIFATLSKHLLDRKAERGWPAFLPGIVMAVVVHSVFNHFLLSPVLSTLILLVVLPVVIVFVFARSESATRKWLGEGWEADVDLLDALTSEDLSETHVGFYLENLREHFPPPVVGDMLSLMQLQVELAMMAKGVLLAREAGISVSPDPEIESKMKELQYLEQNIGKTGLRTLQPLLFATDRDAWQRVLLQG